MSRCLSWRLEPQETERSLKFPVGAIEDLSGALNTETFGVPLPHVLKIKTILNS